MNQLEQTIVQNKENVVSGIKRHIYDWISVLIIIGILAASLDIFEFADYSETGIGAFIASWVPFFIATILLNDNQYRKGIYVGKQTQSYKDAVDNYSNEVDTLNGIQIENLDDFCNETNAKILKKLQTNILMQQCITYEQFDKGTVVNGIKTEALKIYDKKQLSSMGYTKTQVKSIIAAKNVKIKGIHSNTLLSNVSTSDSTDIGLNESQLYFKQTTISTMSYIMSTIAMTLLAVNDILEWGWFGMLLLIIKLVYVVAKSFTSYFNGYSDATMKIKNHILRKTDYIKMYKSYTNTEK